MARWSCASVWDGAPAALSAAYWLRASVTRLRGPLDRQVVLGDGRAVRGPGVGELRVRRRHLVLRLLARGEGPALGVQGLLRLGGREVGLGLAHRELGGRVVGDGEHGPGLDDVAHRTFTSVTGQTTETLEVLEPVPSRRGRCGGGRGRARAGGRSRRRGRCAGRRPAGGGRFGAEGELVLRRGDEAPARGGRLLDGGRGGLRGAIGHRRARRAAEPQDGDADGADAHGHQPDGRDGLDVHGCALRVGLAASFPGTGIEPEHLTLLVVRWCAANLSVS